MGEGAGAGEPPFPPGGAAGEEQLLAATSRPYDVEGDATPPLKSPMHGCGTEGAAKVPPLLGLPEGAALLMAGTDDRARVPVARPGCCWSCFWVQSGWCRWVGARQPPMSTSRAKGDVGDELEGCTSAMCAVSARAFIRRLSAAAKDTRSQATPVQCCKPLVAALVPLTTAGDTVPHPRVPAAGCHTPGV